MKPNSVPLHWQRAENGGEELPAQAQAQLEVHAEEAEQRQPEQERQQEQHQRQQQEQQEEQQQDQQHQGQQQGQQEQHPQEEEHQQQQVAQDVYINETTEEPQSEKENDFIGTVKRSLTSVSYPSGKEIFSFSEKDGDLSFLHYEPPAKTIKVNVSSTTEDSTPIASPLRKRVDTIVQYKVYICKLKSKLLAAETKVQQLQRALKTEKTKNSRYAKRLEKNVNKKFADIDDLLKEKDIPDMAKTILKLQLHKPNTPYTTDEKDLAKQIYFHSAACYS